ncbi:MAG: nucleotide exchange factor GrpE [Elusimicrobiota bacterium]
MTRGPDQEKQEIATAAAEGKVAELFILKESLDQEKAKAAEYYDQLLRLKAEFDNFRKRTEKEKSDHRRWGQQDIILQLVSLMDVMEQAEAAAHKGADLKSMAAGLGMLYGQFKRVLKDQGVEEIGASAGDKFDPSGLHEAVDVVEDSGEEGRILDVLQKGYRFQGLTLRPVRVRVSKKKKEELTVRNEKKT